MSKWQEKRAHKRFLKAAKRPNRVCVDKPDVILTKNYMTPCTYHGINNLNTIVISSVGTGKTRGFLKSNLLSANCSFVVTDTKGELYNEFAGYLQSVGYKIRLIDLAHPQSSNHYNPFRYIHNEEDVCDFAMALSMNVHKRTSDEFWLHTCKNLIAALIFYCFEACPKEEWNMQSILTLLAAANDNTEYSMLSHPQESELDILINALAVMNSESLAVKYYKSVRCAADKTWSSILVSTQQALSVFNFPRLLSLTTYDDVDFELFGTENKVALFINLDDTNNSYDFVAGLIYSQLFKVLYKIAECRYNKTLPNHVRFFMDDFANYKIPSISHYLSTCRSRGISIQMILQSEPQLKAFYGDVSKNLIGNSTYIYIGNNDLETQQNIAHRLGKPVNQIQNTYNKTYVFFPNGPTIVDVKADYEQHPLYAKLDKYNYFNHNVMIDLGIDEEDTMNLSKSVYYDYWDDSWSDYKRRQHARSTGNYLSQNMTIELRDSRFDSEEEKMFYETLISDSRFVETGIECNIHTDLRDIFNVDKINHNDLKYKKIMLMHCDFVFRKGDEIITVLEIDGKQHSTDLKQSQNDLIKDSLFKNVFISLQRIEAKNIRDDCDEEVNRFVEHLIWLLELKEKINTIELKMPKASSIGEGAFLNEDVLETLLNNPKDSN